MINHRMKRSSCAAALVAALVACSSETPQQQIESAQAFLAKNDTRAAMIQVKSALQASPDLREGRFLLADLLLKEGNAVAAAVEFRKALELGQAPVDVVPRLARAMLGSGAHKALLEEFGATRFDRPDADASLQTSLADAYHILGKSKLAEQALTNALTVDPQYEPALLARVRLKIANRDIDGAVKSLDEILARNGSSFEALKLKGDLLSFVLDKRDESLAAYRKAVAVNPDFEAGYSALITGLLQTGKLDEAAAELKNLNRLAPNDLQTKYLEAQIALGKNDLVRARELTRNILRTPPMRPRALLLAGAIEYRAGDYSKAVVFLTRAVQDDPKLLAAHQLLISAYLRSGDSARALEALGAIVDKAGNDARTLALAGQAHLMAGDPEKAETYFARALALDPDSPETKTALAVSRLASGQTSSALSELHAIADTDQGTTADLALVNAYMSRREFDKALAAIDGVRSKPHDKPLLAYLTGRVQLAQANKEAARKSFEQALSINPAYYPAANGLATLDVADRRPDLARERFNRLLAADPKNGQALIALARLAAANGAGSREVASLLERAVLAVPEQALPRLMLIDLHLKDKDVQAALAVARAGVVALPDNFAVQDALGRVHQLAGDVNQAIAVYSQMAVLRPLSAQPQIRLAEAHLANKDLAATKASLLKALEIQPDSLDAQRGLILLALDEKDYDGALRISKTVQRQRPDASIGYLLEGDIAKLQKKWDLAVQAYRAGLERVPAVGLAINLHAALATSGKSADAAKFAASWEAQHPDQLDFVSYLGDFAIKRSDWLAAESIYKRVLKSQPNNPRALNNLAWALGKLKRDEALGYAEKAVQLAPEEASLKDTLATLLTDRNEFKKAIDIQNQAIKLQPNNQSLKLTLAKIYLRSGDKKSAKSELDALAKLGDKFAQQAEVSSLRASL